MYASTFMGFFCPDDSIRGRNGPCSLCLNRLKPIVCTRMLCCALLCLKSTLVDGHALFSGFLLSVQMGLALDTSNSRIFYICSFFLTQRPQSQKWNGQPRCVAIPTQIDDESLYALSPSFSPYELKSEHFKMQRKRRHVLADQMTSKHEPNQS